MEETVLAIGSVPDHWCSPSAAWAWPPRGAAEVDGADALAREHFRVCDPLHSRIVPLWIRLHHTQHDGRLPLRVLSRSGDRHGVREHWLLRGVHPLPKLAQGLRSRHRGLKRPPSRLEGRRRSSRIQGDIPDAIHSNSLRTTERALCCKFQTHS